MSRWSGGPFSGPSFGLWGLVLLDTFLRMNNDPRNTIEARAWRIGSTDDGAHESARSACPQAIPHVQSTQQHRERA